MDAQESEAEDGEAETAREERLRTFADAGYDPIIAVGFAYAAGADKVAEEYPDVHFAIIDDESIADATTSPTWSSPRSRAPSSSVRRPR